MSFILTESSKKSTKVFTDNALVNGLLVGAGAGLLGSLVVGKIITDQQQKCVYRYKRDGTGSARSVQYSTVQYSTVQYRYKRDGTGSARSVQRGTTLEIVAYIF